MLANYQNRFYEANGEMYKPRDHDGKVKVAHPAVSQDVKKPEKVNGLITYDWFAEDSPRI